MIGEEFHTHADNYDEWFERHLPAYLSELDVVRGLLPENGFGIEIGVGTARFAGYLKIPLGVDISLNMLLLARERGTKVVMARGEDLPFHEGIFDYVLMVTLLCFTEKPTIIIREAARILKKEGRLIIGIIDRESLLGRKYQARKRMSRFYQRVKFLSPDELVSILEKEGLSPVDCRQCIFQDPDSITEVESPDKGCGRGAFVAIAAVK
ncbi:MAG: class I SAM-dependent methyltransferase [Candidatus Tritonobacter lacicola]|nr:class I SAM-dependent methyltransferase [Candidatus Tritonobacter lacicola]